MLSVVGAEPAEEQEAAGSVLDEQVRDGARQMPAAVLQAEVTAYVDQFAEVVEDQGHQWWSATAPVSSGR